MKSTFSAFLFAAACVLPAVYGAGFNMGATARDKSCKTYDQWLQDFKAVRSWSTGKTSFNTVKLFSTNDCEALKYAVPAAIATGIKLWVGVWNFPHAKFGAEKTALETIMKVKAYRETSKWLAGINVGSESMYRNETTAPELAQQIYDVKGMVMQTALNYYQYKIPVGTADTWTKWVEGDTAVVIKASDYVMMNGFPYWQGGDISQGLFLLKQAITRTRDAIDKVFPGNEKPPFMLGETGWPSAGADFQKSVPSPTNQQKYWKQAACWLQTTPYQWYWFSAFNEPARTSVVEQNFGIARASDRSLKISLAC